MSHKHPLPCGTDAAFQRHVMHDEEPCQPCVDAHRAKQRVLQATYTRDLRRRTPQGRALELLRRNHPDEYDQILAEETAKGTR